MKFEQLEKNAKKAVKQERSRKERVKRYEAKQARREAATKERITPFVELAERKKGLVSRAKAIHKITEPEKGEKLGIYLGRADDSAGILGQVFGYVELYKDNDGVSVELTARVKGKDINKEITRDGPVWLYNNGEDPIVSKAEALSDGLFILAISAVHKYRFLKNTQAKLDGFEETLRMFEGAVTNEFENPVLYSRLKEMELTEGYVLIPSYPRGGGAEM